LSNILRRLLIHDKEVKVVIFDISCEYPFLLMDVLSDPEIPSRIVFENEVKDPNDFYNSVVKPRAYEEDERVREGFRKIFNQGKVTFIRRGRLQTPQFAEFLADIDTMKGENLKNPNYVEALRVVEEVVLGYMEEKGLREDELVTEDLVERIITTAKQAADEYKVHQMSALYGWFMSRPKMRDYFKLSKKGGRGCSVDDIEELLKGDTRLICLSISEPTAIKQAAIDLTKNMLINRKREFAVRPCMHPTYLNISNDDVEIRDASHLTGKWTAETEHLIRKETGLSDTAIVAEGPASERLVKYSAVTHTAHRAAGRTGLGAVMGSKKLKAIAARGTNKVEVASPEKVRELQKKITKETFESKFTSTLREHGQIGFLLDLNNDGILPTKNFQSSVFQGANKITGQTLTKQLLKTRESCPRCPVACKRVVEVKEGPYAPVSPEYGGPEYESAAALGSLLCIDDLEAICRMNMLCNAYSLDTISTGVCIAFAMECYEKGLLSKEDTGGRAKLRKRRRSHQATRDDLTKGGIRQPLSGGSEKGSGENRARIREIRRGDKGPGDPHA
jgi:hypothetical protein